MAEKKDTVEEQGAQAGAPPARDTRDEVVSTTGARTRIERQPLPVQVSEEAKAVVGNAGAAIRDAQEQGFHGFAPDPTPNSHYTIAGVTAGKPTPETDLRLKAVAQARSILPNDVPFMPADQEQFEQLMAHKADQTGQDTASHDAK